MVRFHHAQWSREQYRLSNILGIPYMKSKTHYKVSLAKLMSKQLSLRERFVAVYSGNKFAWLLWKTLKDRQKRT